MAAPDFVKGASGPSEVYDTSPSGLGMSPAYLAPGASASASSVAGTSLQTYAKATANVTTTGTTFAGGADVLAAALSFTADGTSDYRLAVFATSWGNTGTNLNYLLLNFDSADQGQFARFDPSTNNFETALAAATIIVAPSAGSHTVNARLVVSGGTGTILGASGGAGAQRPILVMVEKL